MKLVFKEAIAFTLAMGIGFGSAVGIKGFNAAKQQKQGRQSQDIVEFVEEEYQMTSQEKLLASVTSLDVFAVNGVFEMKSKESQLFRANINVAGDIQDFANVKVNGNIDMNLNGVQIPAGLKYFDNTIYFNYRENYFKLATEHIMDFVSMLPDYGIGLSMPEELQNLDLNTITTMIDGLEEHASTNGDIYFTLGLSEDITLYVKSDAEYNFKGIRTDHINLNGMDLYLNLDLSKVDSSSVDLVNPKETNDYVKYQDFKPAFDMFDALYNTFKGEQNTIKLAVDLDRDEEVKQPENYNGDPIYERKDFLATDLFFSYDLNAKEYSLAGELYESDRHHSFVGLVDSENIYFGFNGLKMAISTNTVSNLIAYTLEVLGEDLMNSVMDKAAEFLESDEIMDTLANIDSVLGAIRISENEFQIDLNTDAVGLDMGIVTPSVKFSNGKLEKISISELEFSGYYVNVALSVEDFAPVTLNKEEYEPFDPATNLIAAVLPLLDDTEFRLEFDAKVSDPNGVKKDINIDGGLQFDLDDKFGYGQVDIIDRDEYDHNLKIDMKSADEMLFSYNNTLNGKFDSQTLLDMFALFKDIAIDNPDEHWYELFNGFFKKFASTPVGKVLQGDYFALLDAHMIDNLEVTEDHLRITMNLGLVGFEDTHLDLEIGYHVDDELEQAKLDYLKIYNLEFEGLAIEFNAYLTEFKPERAQYDCLDPYKEYLDFSDIKVLLELGIHTSKFDYFHFNMDEINVSIPVLRDITIENTDIQIRNDKGNVQVAAEIDVPMLSMTGIANLINNNQDYTSTHSRHVSLYYEDGIFYIKRVDHVTKWESIIYLRDYAVTYAANYTVDYFLDNAIDIVIKNILGIHVNIDGLINSSTKGEAAQINYEKILKDFRYNANAGTFVFKADLNALTHTSVLDTVDLTVYSDGVELTGVDINLDLHVGLTIPVTLKLTTVSKEPLKNTNVLTEMNNWLAAHGNDTQNYWRQISKVRE